jgi:hypothetical protein
MANANPIFPVRASDLSLQGLTCVQWHDGSQLCSVSNGTAPLVPPPQDHYCTATALPQTLVCHQDKANSERIAVRTSLVSGVDTMLKGMQGMQAIQSDVLAMQGELRRELAARPPHSATPAAPPVPPAAPPAPRPPYGGSLQAYPQQPAPPPLSQ